MPNRFLRAAPELLTDVDITESSIVFFLLDDDKREILKWLLKNYDGLPPLVEHGVSALAYAVEQKDSELAEILIRKDKEGLAWKNNHCCKIEGVKETDSQEEVISKMKAEINK